jgi:Ni2+-binding GTPase involved in maturation of urease and hydrogenase
MERTKLILVGGFLGAGKTTLLANAAARLARAGKRVGLITNDQATNLVDTGMLERHGSVVREVSGGCFCCRFDDLIAALKRLTSGNPDIVIAEPVGSCTDLSATVLQPLKRAYGELFQVAPFSVLVDPARLRRTLGAPAPTGLLASVGHIFSTQLEEADLIVLNKADTLSSAELAKLEGMVSEHFPQAPVVAISALTGQGVDAWLDRVLEERPAGQRIATVDYDVYAEGEAALGWLNAAVALRGDSRTDWRALCLDLLGNLQRELRALSAEIAHVKLLLTAGGASIVANLTSNDGEPWAEGATSLSAEEAELLINARVQIEPDELRSTVDKCLRVAAGNRVRASVASMESFAPARPEPTHRFDSVV